MKKRTKTPKSSVIKTILLLVIIALTLYNAHIILTYKDIVESDKYLLKDPLVLSQTNPLPSGLLVIIVVHFGTVRSNSSEFLNRISLCSLLTNTPTPFLPI